MDKNLFEFKLSSLLPENPAYDDNDSVFADYKGLLPKDRHAIKKLQARFKPPRIVSTHVRRVLREIKDKPTVFTPNVAWCQVCAAPAVKSCTAHPKESFDAAIGNTALQTKDMVCSESMSEIEKELAELETGYDSEELFGIEIEIKEMPRPEEMPIADDFVLDLNKPTPANVTVKQKTISKAEFLRQKYVDIDMHQKAARNHYYTGYMSCLICDNCTNTVDIWPSCWQKRYYRKFDCVYCKIDGFAKYLESRGLLIKNDKEWDVKAIDAYFVE